MFIFKKLLHVAPHTFKRNYFAFMRRDTCHVCCYVMVEEINMHENIMLEVNLTTLEWNVWFVMSVWFGDLGTGGWGGVLRFGSDGGVPLKPPNLYPSLRGHFGGKGYPLLGVFIQENDVFVYFSDEMGENISTVTLQNYTPCLGIFGQNHTPCLGIFLRKSHPFQRHTPVYLIRRVPPPPPV